MVQQNQYGCSPRGVWTIPKDALEQLGMKVDLADIDYISSLELLYLHQFWVTKHSYVPKLSPLILQGVLYVVKRVAVLFQALE